MRPGQVLNGEFISGETIPVDPREPFFAHGFGLFETLRVENRRPHFLDSHVSRMAEAAEALGLPGAPNLEAARRDLTLLLQKSEEATLRVRVHLLGRSDGTTDVLYVGEPVKPLVLPAEPVALGVAAPRFRGGLALPGLKTMNYLVNRLAEKEGRERGFDEVVFTLADGTVTEGSRSTVILVKEGVVTTPPLDLPILPGVTRATVLALAAELGHPTRECRFSQDALLEADEVFLTGSVSGIRPVVRFVDRVLAPVPGPVTMAVARAYAGRVAIEPQLS